MSKIGLFLGVAAICATIGCSSPSPTAPSPPPVVTVPPPVVVLPPAVTPPVIITPPPNPLLIDPRFDRAFFAQFVHNALETPNDPRPLRRQNGPPNFYIYTVDDAGNAIDSLTLNQTASAIESTTGLLTGSFGVASIERGSGPPSARPNLIAVKWSAGLSPINPTFCGYGLFGGPELTLYPKAGCRCAGGPAVALAIVKHELGHVLGYFHTDSRLDLMYRISSACDQEPSAREIFHARVAYSLANGSVEP